MTDLVDDLLVEDAARRRLALDLLPPLIDLTALPIRRQCGEMRAVSKLNPLEHIDREFYGEVRGCYRRVVSDHLMVIVATRLPW